MALVSLEERLPDIAHELHIPSVNELCRRAVVFYLETKQSVKTKEFKAALKQTICCIGGLLMIGLVEFQSMRDGDSSEFRRTGRAKVCRVARAGRGKESEMM